MRERRKAMSCHCPPNRVSPFQLSGPFIYPYPYGACFAPPWSGACCPECCRPMQLCCCSGTRTAVIPEELYADTATSPQTIFIGGASEVVLNLESVVDALPTENPQIIVTITGNDGTTTWTFDNLTAGYHIKGGFVSVEPGVKVKLEASNCSARLRWCETIAY